MKAIRILALAVIVSTFASCSIFKKTSKSSSRSEIEQLSKRDSVVTGRSSNKGEVKYQSVDKGVITAEKETTTTTTKGGTSKVGIKLGDLKHGENYLRDSAGAQVKAVLDTLNKVLTVELDTPKETTTTTVKERTTEAKDKQESREEKHETKVNKQVAIREEKRFEATEIVKEKEERPSSRGIIWGAVGVLIIVLGILFYVGFRPKK